MSNSIGDLKNSGLKGNNWPWQYKVLLGLDKIANSIKTGVSITPNFIASTGDAATAIAVPVYSISFFNNGSVPALVSFDSGASFETIEAGLTISMDAGSINNFYSANTFEYDTVTADPSGSLIITYNS